MILLKRLLLELDIWVLHMPSLNHQSAGWGGWGVQGKSKCSLPGLGRGCCSTHPGCSCWLPFPKPAYAEGMGPEQLPSTSPAPKGFPAAFCRSKVHFKAITFECFPIRTAGLIFYLDRTDPKQSSFVWITGKQIQTHTLRQAGLLKESPRAVTQLYVLPFSKLFFQSIFNAVLFKDSIFLDN